MISNQEKPLSNAQTRTLREWMPLGLGAIVIVAAALMITFQFVQPAPPKSLTIATGSNEGAYFHFAQQYATALAKEGVTLNVKQTAGSQENLNLLAEKNSPVDIAFLQGGIVTDSASVQDDAHLVGLASIYYEPLWVFTTSQTPSVHTLPDLSSKTIAIGSPESGTHNVMQLLLQANQLKDKITTVDLGGREALNALQAGEVDAIAIVSSLSAPIIQHMLSDKALQLMSFKRAEAYSRRYAFLSSVVFPRGLHSFADDLPPKDIHLIAPAATLVAKESLHPALISLLLQAADTIHSNDAMLSPAGTFPSPDYTDYPLSDDARRQLENGPPFLQRYLPFWAANLVDRLKILLLPMLALMLPLSRMLPPLYRWRMRSRVYNWYDEIQQIDIRAKHSAEHAHLQRCHHELEDIEEQVRNIEVPLSFADELYRLRQHIELVRGQVGRQEQSVSDNESKSEL